MSGSNTPLSRERGSHVVTGVSVLLLALALPLSAQVTDGTVASFQKISDTAGNFTAVLDNSDTFGRSVASIGDLDGDGIPDMAVGSTRDDDGGTDRGALYILFMNADGTVKSTQKISDTAGSFTAILDNSDEFGISVAGLAIPDGGHGLLQAQDRRLVHERDHGGQRYHHPRLPNGR